MEDLIKEALLQIGLESVPKDNNESLKAFGMDSLMCALLYSELEQKVGNLSASNFTEDTFDSINSIKAYIQENQK